ncbi:MAG: hypothetical protein L6306_04220 [Planctomycetales bacterium]|nr:hypothetical protein [Planctomycetales bacterium]
MKVDDENWKQWRGWAEKIRDDLTNEVNAQAVFAGFNEVVQKNKDWIDSHNGDLFTDFVMRSYAASAFLGIRRQLKINKDSVSLLRLLDQISKYADQITYDFYLTVFPLKPRYIDWQKWTFRNLSDDGKSVCKRIVVADIADTKKLNTKIELVADRIFAHLDKRETNTVLTFDELRASIDHFNKLTCKYIAFLLGEGRSSLEAMFCYDWKKIFSYPLVKPADNETMGRIKGSGVFNPDDDIRSREQWGVV